MTNENGPKPIENQNQRSEKKLENTQPSKETSKDALIDGENKGHQQVHQQALLSNPNRHTGSADIANPNNNMESFQIIKAIPGTDAIQVLAERQKPQTDGGLLASPKPLTNAQLERLERLEDRLDNKDFPKEVHARIGKETDLRHLQEVFKKHGVHLSDRTIEKIENRIARHEISSEEIKKLYGQVERLLENKSTVGVTDRQRGIIAEQILGHAAEPMRVDQGSFNTCNVTTVECRCFARKPSDAAKLIADVALNGEYHCKVLQPDGKTYKPITVHQKPRPYDDEALDVPAKENIRSFASQIFQVAAINIHYKSEHRGTWYEQRRFDIKHPDDNQERLHKADRSTAFEPELPGNSYVNIYNAIANCNDSGFLLKAPCRIDSSCSAGITPVTSARDLEKKLIDIEKTKNFPVIIGVFTASEPLWSNGEFGGAGGAGGDLGGGHVVTITGIEHGPPMRIKVDNQWGRSADHLSEVTAMSSRDVYLCMLEPPEASREILRMINEDKSRGQKNAWQDLEYDRMRLLSNRYIDENEGTDPKCPTSVVEAHVIDTLNKTFGAHAEKPDEMQAPGILRKLGEVVAHLPAESQIRIQEKEASLGLISHGEYKRQLIDYGKFTTKGHCTLVQKNVFKSLLSKLPQNEQLEITRAMKH